MAPDLSVVLDRMGFGLHQAITLVIIGCLIICDGKEMLLTSALVESISDEMVVTNFMKVTMVTATFIGLMLGGIFAGPIGDSVGRRWSCIISYLFICSFGVACTQAITPLMLSLFRFGVGFGCGIGVSTVTTLLAESGATDSRSHMNNIAGLCASIGEIWAAVGLIIIMPYMRGTGWREVCVWGVMPGMLGLLMAIFALEESPRWLLLKGRYKELDELLARIAARNGVPAEDSSESFQNSFGGEGADSTRLQQAPAPALERFFLIFSSDFRKTTWICCYVLFLCNFLFYGQTYALAQIYQTIDDDWTTPAVEMLITSGFELPGFLLSFAFIGTPWIGHKGSLICCALVSGILSLLLITMDYGLTFICDPAAYFMKLFAASLFNIAVVYVPEAYPSLMRQTAVGFCFAIGRLGSISAPVIYETLTIRYHSNIPFEITCALLAAVGAYLIKQLPFEPKGMKLMDEFHPSELLTSPVQTCSSIKNRV